jgi:hypothetical protein
MQFQGQMPQSFGAMQSTSPLRDAFSSSQARSELLSQDRGYAAWWTRPVNSSTALPSEQRRVEGAGRWLGAPRVRPIDNELQSFGQSSPRRVPQPSGDASPRAHNKHNWDVEPPTDTQSSALGEFSGSLPGLPSMNGTGNPLEATGSSNAATSPHRRRSGLAQELTAKQRDRVNFEEWMATQRTAAQQPVSLGHERQSFTERLHAESTRAEPTPFTAHVHPSPRLAAAGRTILTDEQEGTGDSPLSPRYRQHHKELWPQLERSMHPRVSASNEEHLWAGMVQPGGVGVSHFGLAPTELTNALRRFKSDTGVHAIHRAAGVRESLTDPSYAPPPPVSEEVQLARSTAGTEYRVTLRHERAERHARQQASESATGNFAYRRQATAVTVPDFEEHLKRKEVTAAKYADPKMFAAPLASSDIHSHVSDREFRMQTARARAQAAAVTISQDRFR